MTHRPSTATENRPSPTTPRPLHRSPHWLTPQPQPPPRRSSITRRPQIQVPPRSLAALLKPTPNSPPPRVVTSVAPTSYSPPPVPALGDYSDVESMEGSRRGQVDPEEHADEDEDGHSDDGDTVNGHGVPPESSEESLAQSDFKRPVHTHDFWHTQCRKTSGTKQVTFAIEPAVCEGSLRMSTDEDVDVDMEAGPSVSLTTSTPTQSTDSYASETTQQNLSTSLEVSSSSDPTTPEPEERPYEAPFSQSGLPLPLRRVTSQNTSIESRSTGSVAERIRGKLFGHRRVVEYPSREWLSLKLEWPGELPWGGESKGGG